jgi:hypothetical protein
MVPFKAGQPVFFSEYEAARAIVESAGGRSIKGANVVAVPTAKAA